MNKILMGNGSLRAWTHGCTLLCQSDARKGNAVENYRPITCIPLLWKLLIVVIAEGIYDHLKQEKLLSEEQKGCRRGSRGTKNQILISKTVLKDCKKHTNLPMAWIDHKKVYDFVPHSWINECMELFRIADNVRNFLEKSM